MLHNVLSRTRWSTGALPVGVIKRSLQIRPSNALGHNPPNGGGGGGGGGRGARGAGREYRTAERNARDSSMLLPSLLLFAFLPSCACGRAHLHRATRDHPRSGRSIDIDQAAGEDLARKTCGCSSYFSRRQITGRLVPGFRSAQSDRGNGVNVGASRDVRSIIPSYYRALLSRETCLFVGDEEILPLACFSRAARHARSETGECR